MSILILNCERTRTATGNSLQLLYTRSKPTVDLQILGETVGETSLTAFDYILRGKNLFNKATATANTYINKWNGSAVSETGLQSASDYIPVKGGVSYYGTNTRINQGTVGFAFYDANKTFISGASSALMTAPANAAYLRFTFFTASADTVQVEIGTSGTAVEAYQGVTASVTLKDKDNNQLQLTTTDKIVKVNGKYYHRNASLVDTELCAADQTALASVDKTYKETTNIQISDTKGQVYIAYRARR